MNKIDMAVREFREMDDIAGMDSPIHRLHPLGKLLCTAAYIFITVSFGKYDLSGLSVMLLYPMLLFALSGVPVSLCFKKLRFVLPLVLAVGLFNPIFDRAPLLTIGRLTISAGVVSMLTLMLKGVCCLMASFLLVATTGIDAICAALRILRVPGFLVTLLLLTYRYVSVMMEEVSVMTTAYRLRAPGQKGIHRSAWGSLLGQLLLRSMDRAQELYESMQLRGFQGDFPYARVPEAGLSDYVCTLLTLAALILCRLYNLPELLGRLLLGGLR